MPCRELEGERVDDHQGNKDLARCPQGRLMRRDHDIDVVRERLSKRLADEHDGEFRSRRCG